MQNYDLLIVGAGMVGLTLAAALADSPLRVAVIDHNPAPDALDDAPAVRVSALNLASQQLLENLGVWSQLDGARVTQIQQMQVWENDSFAQIDFDAHTCNSEHLGHIIENERLIAVLLQRLQAASNIELRFAARIERVDIGEREAYVALADSAPISARLLVAADGANSWLREYCQLPLTFWDYDHHALVAAIETEVAHQHTAFQAFSPDGPLAFLPLYESNLSSIVWSLPPAKAQALQALPEDEFCKQLATALDMRLGRCTLRSARAVFPLTMRYARHWLKPRIALVGDAAHTIHPLAGQGVNLGLMDAAVLAERVLALHQEGADLGDPHRLKPYERWRKADTQVMIASMELFKRGFGNDLAPLKLLRGAGLALADKLVPLKREMMRKAMLGTGELPALAQKGAAGPF